MFTQKNTLLIVAIVGALIAAAAVWFFLAGGAIPGNGAATSDTSESADVVARVNGEDITQTQLEAAEVQVASEQGVADLSLLDDAQREEVKTEALDRLIARALVMQAAAAAGIEATEADVDAQLSVIKEQFENDTQYQNALSEQGLTEADLREQMADNIVTQAYLAEALDTESITVSEEEIETTYEAAAEGQEGLPPLSELRDQIEQLVLQQKQQELFETHIEKLRAEADIELLT